MTSEYRIKIIKIKWYHKIIDYFVNKFFKIDKNGLCLASVTVKIYINNKNKIYFDDLNLDFDIVNGKNFLVNKNGSDDN
jgi:hypothetical protein